MAKVDFFRSQNGYNFFYNLDAAVGTSCPNRRDDVLLVQYFLQATNRTERKIGEVTARFPIDGVWNTNWDGILGRFQDDLVLWGPRKWSDRSIDPVPGFLGNHQIYGPIHHNNYKILTLNINYLEQRKNDFPRIADAHDCPLELRSLIRVRWLGHS